MQSRAATVDEYLETLPPDRRAAVEAVRRVIRKNLDRGIEEGMGYGMITYSVPHSRYPAGYHCDPKVPLPYAALASQKHGLSVYLFCLYTDPEAVERFAAAWRATGKRLDMGKSCVRFRRKEDAALDVIGEAIRAMPVAEFIERYEASLDASRTTSARRGKGAGRAAGAGGAPKKAVSKKAVSKKGAAKKSASSKAASKRATARVGSPAAGVRRKGAAKDRAG